MYAHLSPPNAQSSRVVSAHALRDPAKRGSAPAPIAAPVEVPSLPTTSGHQTLAAATEATKGSVSVDLDTHNKLNLQLLASFLKGIVSCVCAARVYAVRGLLRSEHANFSVPLAKLPSRHAACCVEPVEAKWPGEASVHSLAAVRLVALE